MKNGGADVRVLDRNPVNPDGEDWRGNLVASARNIAEFATEDRPLAGYVVIGLFANGSSSLGWRYDPNADVIPRVLLPHWVSEVIRRDMLVAPEARDVFNEMFEWRGR